MNPKYAWARAAGLMSEIDFQSFVFFFVNFEEDFNAHVDPCTDLRLGTGNHTGLIHFIANEWPLCSELDPIMYR
jgi:hypothetical protein